ncbi:hypothetical protein GINT2_001662 [Glugoides intestinalis]
MEAKSFEEVFDKSIFQKNTILIDEQLSQNCDFLILELVRLFGFTVFQWNDAGEFLRSEMEKWNIFGIVGSYYDFNAENESFYKQKSDINDDILAQRMLGHCIKSKIDIFRAATASPKDYYDYDIVIKIEKLISGCSNKIDGQISIFKRDQILYKLKYKITTDNVLYFLAA